MLEQLGDLLRLSLDHSEEQEISLAQELAFVDRYLKLQAVRFDHRLQVSLTSDPQVRDALVPPSRWWKTHFATQCRYGRAPLGSPSRRGGRTATCRSVSAMTVPDYRQIWSLESHAGIGLASIRERLQHLYGPERHSFEVTPGPSGGVRVELSVPLTRADSVS
jgi:two-component system, LytTR family, sensor kinase